jgi:uncharacterized protein YdaU (DUF1376 family)
MATAIEHDTTQHLTIRFEEAGDGWVMARIEEEPAAISQGRTREEAYENVLDALRDLKHQPTLVERVACAVEARVVEPLADRVHRRLAR